MKKCQHCRGHKTILGMGGIRSKCNDCKGLGFLVEVKPVEVDIKAAEIPINPPVTVTTPFIKTTSKKVKINSVKVEQPI